MIGTIFSEALRILNKYLFPTDNLYDLKKIENFLAELPPPVAAKILNYLSFEQLDALRTGSNVFRNLIDKFELIERNKFNGTCYVFGNNQKKIQPISFNGKITQISSNALHTAFISDEKIYTFGDGYHGKLGNGKVNMHKISVPRLVDGPFNKNVTQTSCGRDYTAFISNGRVYTFGDGSNGQLGDGIEDEHNVSIPQLVHGPYNQKVIQVSCGSFHTAFISNGKVYTFGDGYNGKLGDGIENEHSVTIPRLVNGLFNQNVIQVSCGSYHTAFISDGRVYTFGNGYDGKLGDGIEDEHSVTIPQFVVSEYNQNVTQVSCGLSHTAFISDGRVYTFGNGNRGQLGDGIEEDEEDEEANHAVSTPQLVIGLFNQDVTQVSCGSRHTAFVSDGRVYTFGRIEDEHNILTPQLVNSRYNRYVTQVSCGYYDTIFLSQKTDFPVIASCVVCQTDSLFICNQCQEVYCDDCFEKSHQVV